MARFLLVYFFLCMFVFTGTGSRSVMGQGRWNGYYSYKECFDIVETNEFVVGAASLGLILYHKETGSFNVRNKINGLSDSGLSAIGYANPSNTLLVGYNNGNIDLIRDGKVFNIPDLKIESMKGSKRINHFLHYNGVVYCSTDFGILEIDIDKKEIASTFIIGDKATSLKVYNTTSRDGFLYAATSAGVLRGVIENNVLANYENWELFSSSKSVYSAVASTGEGILAARGEISGNSDLVLIKENSTSLVDSYSRFQGLGVFNGRVIVTSEGQINIYNSGLGDPELVDTLETGNGKSYAPGFRDGLLAADGALWFADWGGGIFREKKDGSFEQILPPGPFSNSVYSIEKAGDELWVVPGGFAALHDNAKIPAVVSVLKDGEWIHLDKSNTPGFNSRNARDLINIEVNPLDPDNVFIASWGNGVFEFDKDAAGQIELTNHFVAANSGLQNVPTLPKDRFTRIWGLTFDDKGNLFLSNSNISKTIVVFDRKNDAWYQYDYAILGRGEESNMVGEILIDNHGYKWVYVPQGSNSKGVFVFDDNGTVHTSSDDRYRGAVSGRQYNDSRDAGVLKLWDENGELITDELSCFAKDKDGYIWFGTDVGVVVQYNPGNVFSVERPVFSRVKVPRDDGSGLADFLLENQKVTAISIDGANRKYIGTEGDGVYIISEDGLKTVDHFTTGNSPLPSDRVVDIHIDNNSGEVFIATQKGMIGFMGDAIKGADVFSDVYAHPNPVRPGYEGPITITGLVDRTNVKITDTAGNLVYETISLGGNALWNGRNLKGEKVGPGVYVVFLASPDGTRAEFTKIAIVR